MKKMTVCIIQRALLHILFRIIANKIVESFYLLADFITSIIL